MQELELQHNDLKSTLYQKGISNFTLVQNQQTQEVIKNIDAKEQERYAAASAKMNVPAVEGNDEE